MSRIDDYRVQKAQALETIKLIEGGGWRFSESKGDAPLEDVTPQRLAEKRREVETCALLIQAWERLDDNGA